MAASPSAEVQDRDALILSEVSFTYAGACAPALRGVSLTVPAGAFALVTGNSGAGKSTLVSLACPPLAPAGTLVGDVRVFGVPVRELAGQGTASSVGIVLQDSDAQIVCDDVRSEMAFGLEGLGLDHPEMGQRMAEAATFLGMGPWFDRRTSELSGGQRQTLVLAAVLAMRPRLLLLDEPIGQLDPIAAAAFAALVGRANRELGITVVVVTHDPRAFLPFVTQACRLEAGALVPVHVGELSSSIGPAAADATASAHPNRSPRGDVPLPDAPARASREVAVDIRDLWFRHSRQGQWVFSGLDARFFAGEVHAVLGGNGSGKTTLLRLVGGALRGQRGKVRCICRESVGSVPQQANALVGQESVGEELMAWSAAAGYDLQDALRLLSRLGLDARELLERAPLDLSGGQLRLLVLAKVLLVRPRLLLLDEPTVGLDHECVERVSDALRTVAAGGATVIVATHDAAFAQKVASRASLLFDGGVVSTGLAPDFFAHSWLWGG